MTQTVGIAGGGQLGRMLTDAAHTLGLRTVVLDPTPHAPAGQTADEQITGDYRDRDRILELASKCTVMTYEIESVNADALAELASRGFPVHPTPHTLALIKDKLAQKRFLAASGIAAAPFRDAPSERAAEEAGAELGYPFVLKSRSGGFDGRGNALVESAADIPAAFRKLAGAPAYAEGFVRFEKELAVVAARTVSGETAVYPLVETVHKNHICHMVLAPAPVGADVAQRAHDTAARVLSLLDGAGVFGIELFLAGEEVLVNEIAPRVHNSGHFTMDACRTSQFEQHIRAVAGLSLGDPAMTAPAAVMVNILGERAGIAEPRGVQEAMRIPGVNVHIYGKMETRPERKMGHLTAVADTLETARTNALAARALISI